MKKAIFLDLSTIGPDELSLSALEDLPLHWDFYRSTKAAVLHARIKDAEIIVTNKCVINSEAMSSASQLKYLCAAATGFNHINVTAAVLKDIAVSNVRDYATPSVVQHVYAQILALSTKLIDYNAAVRAGAWQKSHNFCLLDFPIEELSGKTLGIIGYGTLGKAVANVAPALGMKVQVCQHLHGKPENGRLALDELLASADIVSIHLPLNDHTAMLIGEREIALMKRTALLINTARGGIVDERALACALKNSRIGGAAIDVLEQEPPVDGNPLLDNKLPGLIVTPHTAWASRQSRQRLVDQIADNIRGYLEGEIINRVDRAL